MAQQYTKILRAIWADPDFRPLPRDSKLAYIMIVTQPDISACGVLGLRLIRWASLFNDDFTAPQIRKAMRPLDAGGFIIIDEVTEEVLVRTFIRHDGAWKQTNGMASIENAKRAVLSTHLRTLIEGVVATLDGKAKPPVPPTPRSTVKRTVDATVGSTVSTRTSLEPLAENLETNSSNLALDSTSSVNNSHLRAVPAIEADDRGVFPAATVADEFARISLERAGSRITNPAAFRQSERTKALSDPELYRYLAEFPTAPANAVACWLLGDKQSMRNFERIEAQS